MPFFEGQNRDQLRQMYVQSWHKFKTGAPLEPLEKQIAAIIAEHPEYVPLIEADDALTADLSPPGGRMNHFLHLGLHLALRDQVGTDRPAGVTEIFKNLSARMKDSHEAEHAMLEQLAEMIWASQRHGKQFEEREYLEKLSKL